MLDPDLLLLDEPSAGLAPNLVDDMFDRIDDINDAGTTILMVEQNAKEALQRCDRGYVLANGQNRDEGPGNELLHDEEVRQRFLGAKDEQYFLAADSRFEERPHHSPDSSRSGALASHRG